MPNFECLKSSVILADAISTNPGLPKRDNNEVYRVYIVFSILYMV